MSLIAAYRATPYPSPADMAWRVEFSARYQAGLPDRLTELAVGQVEALGAMSSTHARRKEWCKTFPDGALADAVCATVPGTWRNGARVGG